MHMFKLIKQDIQCVFERDPAARNMLEVITSYSGVHAMLFHRMNHQLWLWGLKWPARFLAHLARWLTGVEIHPAAEIGERFFIDHGMGVVIGETAVIGNDCTLYHGVTLGGTSWKKGKRHPTLGDNVVVGAGAKVLGPIELGDGVRVGSNAVVVKDVAKNLTVVGIPGRVVAQAAEPTEDNSKRKEFAKKIGFDAYGMHNDMPDPVVNAIDAMLDHIHAMDEHMQQMCTAIKTLGAEIDYAELPDLGPCEIEKTAQAEAKKLKTE